MNRAALIVIITIASVLVITVSQRKPSVRALQVNPASNTDDEQTTNAVATASVIMLAPSNIAAVASMTPPTHQDAQKISSDAAASFMMTTTTNSNATFPPRSCGWCIASAPYACDNRGNELCTWAPHPYYGGCDYYNFMTPLPSVLKNKTIVFHGDSTLREVVNAISQFHMLGMNTPGVAKSEANMTGRSLVTRHCAASNLSLKFRFDYTFDHLNEAASNRILVNPDTVVVGLGLYLARSLMRNATIRVNLVTAATEYVPGNNVTIVSLQKTAAKTVVDLVCDQYKAPVGFFAATWMDCGHLKHPYRAKKARMSYQQCTLEHTILKDINAIVQRGLDNYPPRSDGCRVHYINPIKCSNHKHPCLTDGVHTRYGGFYANSKAQVLMNAIKAAFSQPNLTCRW